MTFFCIPAYGRKDYLLSASHERSSLSIVERRIPLFIILTTIKGGEWLKLAVRKKDGRTEDFAVVKIFRSIRLAGATDEVARHVAAVVEGRLHQQNQHKVASTQIRAFVLEELRKTNPHAAEAFETYKKAETTHLHH